MSDDNLIGVDPLDWMNTSEVEDLKNDLASEENDNNQETYCLKIDKNFDIRNLDSLCKDVNEKFNSIKNIKVDLSLVGKIDAASIQFLTSLKKTAEDKLLNFEIINPSEYFIKSVNLLGLAEVFN